MGHEKIDEAVIVIVGDGHAHTEPLVLLNTGLARDVRKGSIAIVPVERMVYASRRRKAWSPPPVDEKNVEKAVVIIIQEARARTGCFHQILLARCAADVYEIDP